MVDVIDHEGPAGADGEAGRAEAPHEGEDEGGDDELRGGNFPEPAIPVCGDLPEGIEPVTNLASAWVVSGDRAGTYEPADLPPTTPRIRIGSIGIEADEQANNGSQLESECGPIGWFIAFDLPDPLVPGLLELGDLEGSYFEVYSGEADGCGAGGATIMADASPPISGQLRILAVTDDCVMGEFIDAHNTFFATYAPGTGGFVAQREALPCVPIDGVECE